MTNEDKNETINEKKDKKRIGIASMFDGNEIKDYFNTFFILIGGIEFVILVAHFIGSIGPDKMPFPWKQYFFVSFIAPVVMIVVVGLVIVGFNYYIFGDEQHKKAVEDSPFVSTKGKRFLHSFKYLFDLVRQIPVMAGFLVLCFGSLFLYKLDTILKVAGHIGEKSAFYVFISLASLVVCALIFLLFWLFYKFRLHKFELQSRFAFKQKVMETAGLIILDNNVVLDKEGKVVANANIPELLESHEENTVHEKKLLPDISDRFDFK
jgi:hypothetical protein